jgi:hypothetical protein
MLTFAPLKHQNGSNMEANEALKTILNRSHAQAMAGQAVSMDEVERFMNDKVYELTHPVDAYCVAEPF